MRDAVNTIESIWLEVSNVALNEGESASKVQSIDVQIKGDADIERWFKFDAGVEKFKPLIEAMKDKRPVHAKIGIKDGGKEIGVTELRISFSASATRG
jgi:hypothetical protein